MTTRIRLVPLAVLAAFLAQGCATATRRQAVQEPADPGLG